MHLKNGSLIYSGSGDKPQLAPLYDVLSTIPYIPADAMAHPSNLSRIEQARARCFDGVTDASDLVGGQVIHDDDIACGKRGNQHLLDISAKHVAVHGTVVDEWRGHAGQPECAGESGGFPMAVRHTVSAIFGSPMNRGSV